MLRKAQTVILVLAAVFVGALLVLDIAYFLHGSLEAFPTDEKQSKVKIFTTMIGIILGSIEAIIIYFLCMTMHEKH